MKIINSHYIPLPEPHWLIADPCGEIYEHLGTLTVIEQNPDKKKGEYGIITHQHPVVAFADIGYTEDAGENINIVASLTIPNGQVLDNIDLKDCSQICLSKVRSLSSIRFNILAYKLMVSKPVEGFDLGELIDTLKRCSIDLLFPEEDLQEIDLTVVNGAYEGMIVSDLAELFFAVPFYAVAYKENGKIVCEIEDEKILMEFVNQARAYLHNNPKYRFHFRTSLEDLNEIVEKLNNELNDYLERKEA